jgi:hypothetical protein
LEDVNRIDGAILTSIGCKPLVAGEVSGKRSRMATLKIHLPDEKLKRLRQLAERRHIGMNKLTDEILTIALAEFDAVERFRARAALGSGEEGLRLLDALDGES